MRSIIQFLNYAAPYTGNFMRSVFELENEMQRNGYNIIYVFYEYNSSAHWMDELKNEGKNVYFLTKKPRKDCSILKSIIRSHNVKIIHTHFVGVKYAGILNYLKTFFFEDIILIRHLHNEYIKKHFLVELTKSIIAPYNLTIGCSQPIANGYEIVKLNKKEKVVCVANAIEFSRLDSNTILTREDIGASPDSELFLIFGFDYYRKGVDLAIKAFDKLIKDGHNIELVISLSSNDKIVRDEINKIFGRIPNWIKIVKARDDVDSYYRLCETFISASRSEGFCYALVEAAYCGSKLIASDTPGQSHLKIPFTYEFESENVDSFIKQIKLSITAPQEESANRKKIQKEYVTSKFRLDIWAKSICDIYINFLNNNSFTKK